MTSVSKENVQIFHFYLFLALKVPSAIGIPNFMLLHWIELAYQFYKWNKSVLRKAANRTRGLPEASKNASFHCLTAKSDWAHWNTKDIPQYPTHTIHPSQFQNLHVPDTNVIMVFMLFPRTSPAGAHTPLR